LVISQTLARQLFADRDPVGRRVSLDGGEHWLTVVGVVANVQNNGPTVPAAPEYYRLRMNDDADRLGLTAVAFVRSQLDSRTVSQWARREIAALDSSAGVTVETMPERLDRLNDRPRFLVFVLAIFAFVSVLLAASGLYGVIAFLVSGRTREIGVRAALGATRRDILLLVQRQILLCAVSGLAVGVIASLALTSLIRGLLFQISPHDPIVLGSATGGLLIIALAAAWKPSWKAAHIDPARALRVD
jgi:ABC-type antimicrobial peptide transport system permease subunit